MAAAFSRPTHNGETLTRTATVAHKGRVSTNTAGISHSGLPVSSEDTSTPSTMLVETIAELPPTVRQAISSPISWATATTTGTHDRVITEGLVPVGAAPVPRPA